MSDEFTARLRELSDDFDRYSVQLAHDPAWRDEMMTAVVIEIRELTLERLKQLMADPRR